jgi:hypothetical protein
VSTVNAIITKHLAITLFRSRFDKLDPSFCVSSACGQQLNGKLPRHRANHLAMDRLRIVVARDQSIEDHLRGVGYDDCPGALRSGQVKRPRILR